MSANYEHTRGHSRLPSEGARADDPRMHLTHGGQGSSRQREHDSRMPDDLEQSGGRLDARLVTIAYVDPKTGAIWQHREAPRIYCPIPGDWNAMTAEPMQGSDGREHFVILDGVTTIFPQAQDRYSPDVGQSIGTAHLPPEAQPIPPGRRFGPARRHADIAFLCPDTFHKRPTTPGDYPGGAGLIQKRTTAAPDIETAATDRQLRGAEVEDLTITMPDGSTRQVPLTRGAPGYTAWFPFLHERLPLNARGNSLLPSSTVPSPFGGVLDMDTVEEYLRLDGASFTVSGYPYCSLLPYPGATPVDLNRYSYQVGIALLAEYVENMGIDIIAENVERVNNLAHAVAAFAHDIVCAVLDSDDFDEFKGKIRSLNTDARMEGICQTRCVDGPVITPPDREPGSP